MLYEVITRIERAMQRQASEVLAADLRLDSRQPLDPRFAQQRNNFV